MAAPIPVAETMKAVHETVLVDLQDLQKTLPFARHLHAALTDARTHLARQFRFEEKDGYMIAVRQQQPNCDHAVEALRLEHGCLERMLEEMIEEANRVATAEEALRNRVRSWIEEVRQHESAENTLVQEVFNQDVGAED